MKKYLILIMLLGSCMCFSQTVKTNRLVILNPAQGKETDKFLVRSSSGEARVITLDSLVLHPTKYKLNNVEADYNGNFFTSANNSTTTALTSSQLNSSYGYEGIGFQVHCLSITNGPLIYTKTALGWASHPVTVLTNPQ